MEKLSIGDKVQVIYCHDEVCVGKIGKIVYFRSGHKPYIRQREPYFDIEFEDGTALRDLKDWQLRKL
jgi:hypothetical protein